MILLNDNEHKGTYFCFVIMNSSLMYPTAPSVKKKKVQITIEKAIYLFFFQFHYFFLWDKGVMCKLGGFLHWRNTSLVWEISSCELCLISHWELWETWKYKSRVEYITETVQYKSQSDTHTFSYLRSHMLWMSLCIIMQLYWLINQRMLTWTFRISLLS